MPAIEVTASIFWARESMRGSESMASTVAFLAASCFIKSGFCAGQMKSIRVPPSRNFVRCRRAGLEHAVRIRPQLGRTLDDRRACGAIVIVADVGRVARAG